ncbi:aminoglycoside phosphotransferase family protein [Streptomyces sp. N35]|uniref:aminoglycoside phosphotransferase family protein n=1 Tax=Streptomyces sp. N35 TaxID=2795730 RepID=UPI0035AC190C
MDEVRYETELVRALLREQHPDLAELELREVVGGWDNQQFRLGDELAVRMPRTERAPELLRAEQRWLPELASRLPLPTPVPVRTGEPSELFGHTWSVVRWVEGEPADRAPVTDASSAGLLAEFLGALHEKAPDDAPANPARDVHLAQLRGVKTWFKPIRRQPYAAAVRDVWEKALGAPAWQGPRLWLHGDLHPANVVVRDGTLAGVIDFGDMCAGDPATDLSAAWILLPAGAASPFFDAYERADAATVDRARGWAVLRALNLIAIGRNGRLGRPGGKPTWEPAGYATLERVLGDGAGALGTKV